MDERTQLDVERVGGVQCTHPWALSVYLFCSLVYIYIYTYIIIITNMIIKITVYYYYYYDCKNTDLRYIFSFFSFVHDWNLKLSHDSLLSMYVWVDVSWSYISLMPLFCMHVCIYILSIQIPRFSFYSPYFTFQLLNTTMLLPTHKIDKWGTTTDFFYLFIYLFIPLFILFLIIFSPLGLLFSKYCWNSNKTSMSIAT